MQYIHPHLEIASRREHTLQCIYGFRQHNTGQYGLLSVVVQVLAAFHTCIGTAAARAFPLGVFLYAYILRQCGQKTFKCYITCSFACRLLPCLFGFADALSVLFDC